MTADSKKKGHGGARPGAGRPKRGDYEEVKSASQILRAKAREHGPAALQALIDVATSGPTNRNPYHWTCPIEVRVRVG